MEYRFFAVAMVICVWLGGCSMINNVMTEEVINPYTGNVERVQKQYLTWEKGTSRNIFMAMLGITGALFKMNN